jgi:hypothetical protein
MFKPDIIIDYMQVAADGFITVATTDLPAGTNEGDHIVVGDYDAKPAVARVLEIRADKTSILVLPTAERAELLERVLVLVTVLGDDELAALCRLLEREVRSQALHATTDIEARFPPRHR